MSACSPLESRSTNTHALIDTRAKSARLAHKNGCQVYSRYADGDHTNKTRSTRLRRRRLTSSTVPRSLPPPRLSSRSEPRSSAIRQRHTSSRLLTRPARLCATLCATRPLLCAPSVARCLRRRAHSLSFLGFRPPSIASPTPIGNAARCCALASAGCCERGDDAHPLPLLGLVASAFLCLDRLQRAARSLGDRDSSERLACACTPCARARHSNKHSFARLFGWRRLEWPS